MPGMLKEVCSCFENPLLDDSPHIQTPYSKISSYQNMLFYATGEGWEGLITSCFLLVDPGDMTAIANASYHTDNSNQISWIYIIKSKKQLTLPCLHLFHNRGLF